MGHGLSGFSALEGGLWFLEVAALGTESVMGSLDAASAGALAGRLFGRGILNHRWSRSWRRNSGRALALPSLAVVVGAAGGGCIAGGIGDAFTQAFNLF